VNLSLHHTLALASVNLSGIRVGDRENLLVRITNVAGALAIEIGGDKRYVRVILDRDEAVRVEQVDGVERRYLQRDTQGKILFLKDKPRSWNGREYLSLPSGLSVLLGDETAALPLAG
jgi:hypothetical protein